MAGANFSDINLQSLLAAPEGEMQSKEPLPMDFEAPVESPIEEPEAPEEMTLGKASIQDIINVILGRFDLLPKYQKVLEKIPAEAKEKAAEPEMEETPEMEMMEDAGEGGEGYGAVPLDAVDQPQGVTGGF